MSGPRFLGVTLFFAALAALLVAAVCALVDPYLLFNRPRVVGFNAVKPAVETREPLMKTYQSPRVQARTLVLGSSRADIGLNPASPAWAPNRQPVYNLSIVGSDLATNLVFLERMLAQRPREAAPTHLVVGLDFEAFLYPPGPATPVAAAESGPPGSNLLGRWPVLQDHLAALLTLDALQDSVSTVLANRGGPSLDLADNGRLSEGHLRRWTAADGVALLFEQKNRLTVRRYAQPHHVLSDSPGAPVRDMVAVHALATLAQQHGMSVTLIVQPSHASRLELLAALGYWPDIERWKRELAAFGELARANGLALEVFDFGGYEPFMHEAVPPAGDRQRRLRWFWDPVHYSTELGDAMLAALQGPTDLFPQPPRLTAASIEARLQQVRRDRETYLQAHTADVGGFCRLVPGTRCGAPLPQP